MRVSEERKRQLLEQAVGLLGHQGVAKALGVPEPTLHAWINGDERMPQRQLLPLADALAKFASDRRATS